MIVCKAMLNKENAVLRHYVYEVLVLRLTFSFKLLKVTIFRFKPSSIRLSDQFYERYEIGEEKVFISGVDLLILAWFARFFSKLVLPYN